MDQIATETIQQTIDDLQVIMQGRENQIADLQNRIEALEAEQAVDQAKLDPLNSLIS